MSATNAADLLLQQIRDRFRLAQRVSPEAFFVGGAVRDLLLGLRPGDLDIVMAEAAAAAAKLAEKARGRVVTLGRAETISFRVVAGGEEIDFTELPAAGIERDLARRDFTVNAIALSAGQRGIIDPFGGLEDVRSSTLRMIDPQNFKDDPLRVLRGVRFAAALGFEIEPLTFAAMRECAPLVGNVAPERVRSELDLMMRSTRPSTALALLGDLRLHDILFGEVIPSSATRLIDGVEDDPIASFAVVLHELPSGSVAQFLERWLWSREDTARLRMLLDAYRNRRNVGATSDDWRVELHRLGLRASRQLQALLTATGDQSTGSLVARALEDTPFDMRPLLSGHDIQALLELEPGPVLGRIKDALLEAQLRGEVADLEEAKEFVKKRKTMFRG